MPRTTIPLSSFDPRFRQLLLRGSQERFVLECETPSEANTLRANLHTFRAQTKKQRPDDRSAWEPLYGCIISIEGAKLILKPRRSILDRIFGDDSIPETTSPSSQNESRPDPLAEFDK